LLAKARSGTMSWDPRTTYDVSEKELNLMKKRADMRSQLKAYWNKEFSNPHLRQFGGYVFDPQIQRWAAARASYYEYFKPTAKNFRFLIVTLLIPVAGFMKLYHYENDWKEEQFTSGTIAYQDRKPPTDSGRP